MAFADGLGGGKVVQFAGGVGGRVVESETHRDLIKRVGNNAKFWGERGTLHNRPGTKCCNCNCKTPIVEYHLLFNEKCP